MGFLMVSSGVMCVFYLIYFLKLEVKSRNGNKVRFNIVLVHSRCYNNNSIDWVAYKQEFISHGSGGWKSRVREPAWLGEAPLPLCRLLVASRGGRSRELCGVGGGAGVGFCFCFFHSFIHGISSTLLT